ncbi:hypothetical protein L7F22_003624 [Adiantum nelumboides]|nr:hypothetical protein [Adiantum nelumboides]
MGSKPCFTVLHLMAGAVNYAREKLVQRKGKVENLKRGRGKLGRIWEEVDMWKRVFPKNGFGGLKGRGIKAKENLTYGVSNGIVELLELGYGVEGSWVEAKPVKQITSKDVVKFVYEDICCKFGMPLELLSDKGPGFRGGLVDYLCEKLHVRRRFTTPYYPHCNRMNERFNGELIRILTKIMQSNEKIWDLELPCALWAYRTAIKTGTSFSPFHLVFGKEALLPIEVEISALKMMLKFKEANHDALKERLLYLQCLQLDRALALEHYEQILKTSQANANAKVKDKGIKKGDMVLRYNSKLDSTFQKKFQIKWQGPFLVLDRFPNGTYQLADLNGTLHKARVNGYYRLKKYYARLMVVIEDEPSFEESADMVVDCEEIMKTTLFALQALFAGTADHE